MNEDAERLIRQICLETRLVLDAFCGRDPRCSALLERLRTFRFDADEMRAVHGSIPAHEEVLRSAVAFVQGPKFGGLKTALDAGLDSLQWRVDDGGFYASGADVGAGYKSGNMHSLLIGPHNAPIPAEDFLLGFFLLAPHRLYRDHRHLAPELYVPLTGPSGWRFDRGPWEARAAGEALYNRPGVVHATRVGATPFLALFVWEKDIGSPCEVVPAED